MSSADPAATATPSAAPKARLSTTEKLLVGILAALVLLVASVLALAGTVYYVALPAPAPAGPTVTVEASGTVTNGRATYSLADASGTTTVSLSEPGMSADTQGWVRQVPFGATIELNVTMTEVYNDDGTGETGSATCALTVKETTVSKGEVNVANGVGSCTWTNNGK